MSWRKIRAKGLRFWTPAIVGAILTPFCLWLSLMATGAGHGSFIPLLLFYPLPALLLFLFADFSSDEAFIMKVVRDFAFYLTFGLALVQFPLYGFVLSYWREKRSFPLSLGAILISLHVAACVIFLVIAGLMMVLT